MANPNAEAQRRWRERQKQKRLEGLKLSSPNQDTNLFRRPFFEAIDDSGNASNVDISLDLAGIAPVEFLDDSGPRSFTGQIEQGAAENGEEPYQGAKNSLNRAEIMVGCLIDAAAELAGIINSYKRKEITLRIAEIESSDLADLVERKAALAQIVRLNKVMEQLDRQVRWTFKQWKIDES
jgi:hypothetical protein